MLLSPPDASSELHLAFLALGLAVAAGVVALVGTARAALGHAPDEVRKTVIASALFAGVWVGLWLGLAALGVFARTDTMPPPLAIVLVAVVGGAVGLARSRVGEWLATGLSTTTIIGLQAFRLPLELTMHRAATEGVMPMQMSYSGFNFDIVTGIFALVVLLAYRGREVPRAVAIAFAVVGSVLLVAIVTISVASAPLFHAFGESPDRLNTWVFFPPFVLLPSVLVATALLFQLVLARRLVGERADTSSRSG